MSRDISVCLLVISMVICTVTGAAAAGFAILQQGTAAMAEGNAFVAQADDPSAIFYNPAGLTQLQRPEIYFNNVFSATNRTYMTPAGAIYHGQTRYFLYSGILCHLPGAGTGRPGFGIFYSLWTWNNLAAGVGRTLSHHHVKIADLQCQSGSGGETAGKFIGGGRFGRAVVASPH